MNPYLTKNFEIYQYYGGGVGITLVFWLVFVGISKILVNY